MANDRAQQLHATNLSVHIGEALEARTKDPLWFLARQWQSGEFAAENGGRPAYLSLSWREHPLERATIGGKPRDLNLDQPLEYVVERESEAGDAPAWRSAALEYAFEAETARHRFAAEEYHGRSLDWYHFDYAGPKPSRARTPETKHCVMTPTQIHVPGAPHPRWWRLEEADTQFDSPEDPEPNVLSTLLPEFFYLDVNNWYVAPLPTPAGTLREMVEVTMVDSFGVATKLQPTFGSREKEEWRLFAADAAEDSRAGRLDGRFLLMPHVALNVLHNDDVEDVRFLRDEEANLVWAYEHRYRLEDGTPVVNGDRSREEEAGEEPGEQAGGGLARFVLRSETDPEWIPYVPRHVVVDTIVNGQVYLRRARSRETASQENPQYRSRVVSESWRINEEEVPRSGVRVRRIARFARGSDGEPYFWIGREKEAGRRMVHPDLRFDYLEKKPTS